MAYTKTLCLKKVAIAAIESIRKNYPEETTLLKAFNAVMDT
ncbi:putative Cro/Cl-type repressor [Salmonella phage 21]|nr:putative Cro/Cl-type repressor [Salmonella phage 21]